jgi:hypothetical protein
MIGMCGGVFGRVRPAVDRGIAARLSQRRTRRFAIGLLIAVAALPALARAATDPADDALRIYAVNVVLHPAPPWPGYGIYLGRGLVITAAHVVDPWRPVSIRFGDQELPATIVKAGKFDREDLTLLSVDEAKLPIKLRLRRLPLCEKPPGAGKPVVVVVPEGTTRSLILSSEALPPDSRTRFPTVIRDVATTGNSGSGVFDLERKCLLGIMSRKIQIPSSRSDGGSEMLDLAKYFVPAKTISEFIPIEYHF